MAEVWGKVYKETNYKIFRRLLGNRDVTSLRVKKIMESIEKIGYIPSPIIVNEKMEVIDGQGRLAACKELELPIYYIIVKGIGIDECISMNINQGNWKPIDYAKSYAEQGMQSYKYLMSLIEQFPEFGLMFISSVSMNQLKVNRNNLAVIKGTYTCTEEMYNRTVKKLTWIKGFYDIVHEIGGHSEYYYNALSFCYEVEEVNNAELRIKCEQNKSMLISVGTVADAVQQIEKIYNLHKSKKYQLLIKYASMVSTSKGQEHAQRALIRNLED